MSLSSSTKVCFNSNCKEASDKWRKGWRRRSGEYANLCDHCASAYEEGKFCETFHSNASGWRCCESCGKHIHCGCIVSFHMFVLLDSGGIECLTCAKKSYILTPNPAWPPPSHFLPSQPERMKEFSVKTWSGIVGSGPVPWHQAPTLFKDSNIQSDVQPRMPFEIDASGGIDLFRTCERLSTASPEKKQEISDERFFNGKLRVGPFETIQNGNSVLNPKDQPYLTVNDVQSTVFQKNDSSSNLTLATASSTKIETDYTNQLSATFSQPLSQSISVGKQVGGHCRMDLSGETHIRNGKIRVDGRGRNQLLPRYRPQITDEELLQLSSDSKSVITPLFEKMLSASDAGRIGRLVLPKKCAEAYFPPIAHPEGLPLKVQDLKGKEWVFQFRFWPNNNSRMYVLEGITPCIQSMRLQAGDVVTFSRLEPEGKLVMGGRKASTVPSFDKGDEATIKGNDASIPGNDSAKNKYGEGISINGHMKGKSINSFLPINQAAKLDTGCTWSETLEDKPLIRNKRKGSILVAKSKRLRIENEGELKLTLIEAQGLMRPPAKTVPSVFLVEGCEFEEFEENAPVLGRPTIPAIDHFGVNIQWVQCEDCFKWRKVPSDTLLPSRWICSENVWDLDRSQCSAAEELSIEQLEDILPAIYKVSSKEKESAELDADLLVAQEGLDTLANLAIQGEDEGLPASSEARTKHPRHKPGCTCIVCIQPPSGKGSKHEQSCDCIICSTLKRRFRTLMERREKKQLEKLAESASQNLQWQLVPEHVHDVDTNSGTDTGNGIIPNQEEVNQTGRVGDHNGKKPSASPLKGQIDLNIQPEREEESSPIADFGPMKHLLPHGAESIFRQQRSSNSDIIRNLVEKQQQQDAISDANLISCIALDSCSQKN